MLFQNIEQFKQFTTVQKNMSFATLWDALIQAEMQFIAPLIDTPQYLELINHVLPYSGYQTPQTPTDVANLDVLLPLCRRIIAKATMYIVYPHLNITEGDMGVQQNKALNDTSAPATQWAYNDSKHSYLEAIATNSEVLLSFLQENQDKYPLWKQSKAFTEYNNLFIRNNRELGEFLNTQNSIRVYKAFRPFLELAEDKYIAPIVPEETLLVLKAAMSSNNLNDSQKILLRKIRQVIAWYAFFEGLPFLNIKLEGTAISIAIIQNGSTKHQLPTDKDKHILREATEQNALLFFNKLKSEFEQTKDLTSQSPTTFDNRNKPDFWV